MNHATHGIISAVGFLIACCGTAMLHHVCARVCMRVHACASVRVRACLHAHECACVRVCVCVIWRHLAHWNARTVLVLHVGMPARF